MRKRYIVRKQKIKTALGKQTVYRIYDKTDRKYIEIWNLKFNAQWRCDKLNRSDTYGI